jgi:Protein of unknown function (DUF2510)
VATPSDQPGWRPDPEQPGMVRWWNGLGWSDTRRRADDDIAKVRQAADDAARGSTISPQQVAKTTAHRSPLKAASDAVVSPALSATNPFAAGAVAVGVIGLLFGALGVLPAIGLVVSLLGLVRSRRLARDGARRTGFGQSIAGLVLSLVGLLRWLPVLAPLLGSVLNR